MAKEKQYVFSARTTEEGLRALNELKAKLNIGWDELVIDAVCAHYGLDRAVMIPTKQPKQGKQPKEPKTKDSKAEARGSKEVKR